MKVLVCMCGKAHWWLPFRCRCWTVTVLSVNASLGCDLQAAVGASVGGVLVSALGELRRFGADNPTTAQACSILWT
jgi:hypothetical protein